MFYNIKGSYYRTSAKTFYIDVNPENGLEIHFVKSFNRFRISDYKIDSASVK